MHNTANSTECTSLPLLINCPEQDDGNIEYKRFLLEPDEERLEKLSTQMRYRIEEGRGECYYVIGLDDNGDPYGLLQDEFQQSQKTLSIIAEKNNYNIRLLCTTLVNPTGQSNLPKLPRSMYEFIVRENTFHWSKYEEIRVTIAGAVDSAKSSTVGVLVSGEPDNGRGASRLHVFNYEHEVRTGRSSSISHQIMGFDLDGHVTNRESSGSHIKSKTWPEIIKDSSKIVSFYDLCGHQKYMKTTISGMSASMADVALIMVGGNMGMNRITREHVSVCVTLGIPIVFLITKIDLCDRCPDKLEDTLSKVKKFLRMPGVRKIPFTIKTMQDVVTCAQQVGHGNIAPIFKVSNVTLLGINLLTEFLNLVRPRIYSNPKLTNTEPVQYHISDTFMVDGIGLVTGGFLKKGTIKLRDKLFLGPMGMQGTFMSVTVRSIHIKRVLSDEATAGRYVCLNIKSTDAKKKLDRKMIKKGHVLLDIGHEPKATRTFDAKIIVYRTHHTTIRLRYEPVLHVNALRTATKLIKIVEKDNVQLTKFQGGTNDGKTVDTIAGKVDDTIAGKTVDTITAKTGGTIAGKTGVTTAGKTDGTVAANTVDTITGKVESANAGNARDTNAGNARGTNARTSHIKAASTTNKNNSSDVQTAQSTNPKRARQRRRRRERAEELAADKTDMNILRLGDRAVVRLAFKYSPCFLCVGDRILLTESDVRMTGEIINIVD